MSPSRVIRKISSRSNTFVKNLIRERDQKLIFEGEKLVKDILNSGADVSILILHEIHEGSFPVPNAVREVWFVNDNVLNKISALKNQSEFMVVIDPTVSPLNMDGIRTIIVLDNIQDPVNMGSVFRCAAAFGIKSIFLTGQTVKITNLKFLRVAQDSYFSVNSQYVDTLDQVLDMLMEKDFSIYMTSPQKISDPIPIGDIKFPCAVVFGNEGQGINSELIKRFPSIQIDQTSDVDSLNVGMCACIVMYELQKLK